MSIGTELFGRGIAFPARLDRDGRVAVSSGPDNVRESIRIIIMTDPGERLMLPSFGAGLRSFLFEPNIASTHRLIEERITLALRRWEPRVQVSAVEVDRHREDPEQATVTVTYTLVATQTKETVAVAVRLTG